jgi:hypothetical protein
MGMPLSSSGLMSKPKKKLAESSLSFNLDSGIDLFLRNVSLLKNSLHGSISQETDVLRDQLFNAFRKIFIASYEIHKKLTNKLSGQNAEYF